MKTFIFFICLFVTSISLNAQQRIEGLWDTGKDNTTIEIINEEGNVHSSDNAKATTGKLIIKNLKKTSNSYKGKLFIIKKNRWVDAEFVPKENTLYVTISAGWQSKTLKWTLVKKS